MGGGVARSGARAEGWGGAHGLARSYNLEVITPVLPAKTNLEKQSEHMHMWIRYSCLDRGKAGCIDHMYEGQTTARLRTFLFEEAVEKVQKVGQRKSDDEGEHDETG